MKTVFLIMLILSSIQALAQPSNQPQNRVTISVVSSPYMPYLGDGKTTPDGFILEIFRKIFETRGYNVKYVVGPWIRMLSDVREGVYDAALFASKDNGKEFDLLIDQECQLGAFQPRFFVKKGNPWRYHDINSLQKVIIGTSGGYSYYSLNDYIQANRGNQHLVDEAFGEDSILKNLKKLSGGRIEVMYEDKLNTLYEAKKLNLNDSIEDIGSIDAATPGYVAWTKKNPNVQIYSTILKNGIIELRKTGELKTILDKYEVTDWQ